ncbi:thioesterase family protein [Aquibium sp. LZ166]|uniref:Thioesterase family protein n=1 Tax=Aquibium pacificus TaxID=3153579 RepID=A0ABV3SCT1_9HYPH
MGPFAETHRSFVNTWECDDNDHLNVQFYFKRFDEAARLFAGMRGGRIDGPLPATRHVRFHAELRAGTITRTRSGVIADGPFAGHSVHLLDNLLTGKLAASALDAPCQGIPTGFEVQAVAAQNAVPRGLEVGVAMPIPGEEMLARGGLISQRTIVAPAECDAAGDFLEQFYIGRFTDAAPHVWERAGVGIALLQARNIGRVALEMKITHHMPARAGEGLVLYSLPLRPGGKTLHLRHELVRLGDGKPIATGEVVAILLDLSTRRTVPLPSD